MHWKALGLVLVSSGGLGENVGAQSAVLEASVTAGVETRVVVRGRAPAHTPYSLWGNFDEGFLSTPRLMASGLTSETGGIRWNTGVPAVGAPSILHFQVIIHGEQGLAVSNRASVSIDEALPPGPGGETELGAPAGPKAPAKPAAVPVVADFIGTPTAGDKPLTVMFQDLSKPVQPKKQLITSWSWTFGDGGTSTEQNPTHVYQNTGTYTVSLEVVGPGGKKDTQTRGNYITVTEPHARRVVCIDIAKDDQMQAVEDVFLSNHEGYERMRKRANDVIVRGGTLTACLMMVMNGDTLVIVAHGETINGNAGAGFTWCGETYTGFGAGAGQMPVPAGFDNLQNVNVELCTCWSANDPDGGGPDNSLTDKILAAMGGHATNHATGFVGKASISNSITYDYPPSVDTEAEVKAYEAALGACLKADETWGNKAPVNRSNPAPNPNQQSCLEAVINACAGVTPKPRNLAVLYDNAPVNTFDCDGPVGGACGETGFELRGSEASFHDDLPTQSGGNCASDPGFEDGTPNAFWTEDSTNFGTPICNLGTCGAGGGAGPRTGDFWVFFGGIAAFEAGSVEQTVTLPPGAETLEFYLDNPVSSGNGTDFVRVKIDGVPVFQVLTGDPIYANGYALAQVDVSAYADGGPHLLRFESEVSGVGGVTNFFVDDVLCVSGP